jgi:F-type H+-transporting ATPase subunit epsilon
MAESLKMFRCRLITPEKELFDGESDFVILRAASGDMGVLAGHEPMTATMGYGLLKIYSGDDVRYFAVLGGFAEVCENGELTILSDDAQRPDEIDPERARKTRADNEQRIKDEIMDRIETGKMEAQMRRAQVRLEVSSYPIITGRRSGEV